MDTRTIICIICTILSSYGLAGTLIILFSSIVTFGDETRFKLTDVTIFLLPLVSVAAWYFYFKISGYWINYDIVSKKLKVRGLCLGSLAVILSMGSGLVFCFPSILLMIYIYFTAPESKKAAPL
ncbi:hypothetical protein [Litorilituus sediminis]|uniref:Uncharacterized protein n=1 Tax=Litorilituus sediminis TaxID=718192 RepID=A0A4P6P5J6_9GAMM|nr:hypothetical protein [Litorilituus sediminis]QBG35409.1 hypothetical protein EMK97_06585 [Litorilituus sediminis]